MSYLLSSVVPVLYCDTNGPTRAPAFLSLAPSTGFQCLLLRSGHCGLCASLSCFTEWCIHSVRYIQQLRCCSIRSVVMICFLCTLILSILASNSIEPLSLLKSKYFNLLVPCWSEHRVAAAQKQTQINRDEFISHFCARLP